MQKNKGETVTTLDKLLLKPLRRPPRVGSADGMNRRLSNNDRRVNESLEAKAIAPKERPEPIPTAESNEEDIDLGMTGGRSAAT